MATATAYAQQSTWLNPKYPEADNVGNDYVQTYAVPANWFKGNYSGVDYPLALFKFQNPNIVKYKKITRVTLEFKADLTQSYSYSWWNIYPYISDESLQIINYSSFLTYGTVGSHIYKVHEPSTPQQVVDITVDITSAYQSSLKNDEFNVFISGGRKIPTYLDSYYPFLTIEYEEVAQLPPTPIYPKDTTVLETESLLFGWQYNSATEATQAAIRLEYKKSTDANYTVITSTQTAKSYTVNASFTPGEYMWRMKVTNDANETSAYSEVANFVVIGKPAAPIISAPDNKTLTEINWTTADQHACEIRLLDSSGNELIHETLATSETSYKPNMFLKGAYVFEIRVKNSSDLWSDWAQISFNISAAGPSAGTLSLIPLNTEIKLLFTIPSSVSGAIIRRDGNTEKVLVANLTDEDTEYIDYTVEANKDYKYVLRTYVNGYTDTAEETGIVFYDGFILNSDYGNVNLKVSEEKFLPHSESVIREASVTNYSGREYPLVETGEHTTQSLTKKVYIPYSQKDLIDTISKHHSVYFRDGQGHAFNAAIVEVSYSGYMASGYSAELKLVRTQETEVIVNV